MKGTLCAARRVAWPQAGWAYPRRGRERKRATCDVREVDMQPLGCSIL